MGKEHHHHRCSERTQAEGTKARQGAHLETLGAIHHLAQRDDVHLQPENHQVSSGGVISWVPQGGGGALGTVSATWSAPAKKKSGHHKATPALSVSATSQQFFSGLWSLTQSATTKPTKCSVTLDFAPPTASTVTTRPTGQGSPNHRADRLRPRRPIRTTCSDVQLAISPRTPGRTRGSTRVTSPVTLAGSSGGVGSRCSRRRRALRSGQATSAASTKRRRCSAREYDYLLGPILMRISGTFTPTTAGSYGSALTGSTLYVPQAPGATTTTTAP